MTHGEARRVSTESRDTLPDLLDEICTSQSDFSSPARRFRMLS